jgi:hypothetical protein
MYDALALANITLPEAITLTEQINTTVENLLKQHTKDLLGSLIIEKRDALLQVTESLHKLSGANQQERRDVDNANDSIIAGLRNTLRGIAQIYSPQRYPLSPEQQQRRNDALSLLNELFPQGTGFLKDAHTTQYGQTRILLQNSRLPPSQAAIERLGMTHDFTLLLAAHQEYGRAMGFTETLDQPSLLETWAETLEGFLAAALASHGRTSAIRAALFAPYNTMREKIRERRARERQKAQQDNPSQETPAPSES